MNHRVNKLLLSLIIGVLALGWAQETQGSGGMMQGGASGGMSQSMMGDNQDMMQMMNTCATMMQNMAQMMNGEPGGRGMMGAQMDMGQMNMSADAPRYDQAAAEALARAFLSGNAPDTESTIQNVNAADGTYTVGYRQGDTSGTLTVDATTGEVQLQTSDQ